MDFALVYDFVPDRQLSRVTPLGDRFLFLEQDPDLGLRTWVSRGDFDSTELVVQPNGAPLIASNSPDLTVVAHDQTDGITYLIGNDTPGTELRLWQLAPDTTRAVSVPNAPVMSSQSELLLVNGTLYFTAHHYESESRTRHSELWIYSQESGQVSSLFRLQSTRLNSTPSIRGLTSLDGQVLFLGFDDEHGEEWWTAGGIPDAALRISDIAPGPSSPGITAAMAVGDALYFVADDGARGPELWMTDGTLAGTNLVRDIRPGPAGSGIAWPAVVGEELFFVANDGVTGSELWRSNGTTDGTVQVADLVSTAQGPHILHLTGAGDRAYFIANDGVHGNEMWTSDGTSEGTHLVKDINPGNFASTNRPFAVVKNQVYFSAYDGVRKSLWTTDGTEERTSIVYSFEPIGGLFLGDVCCIAEIERGIVAQALTLAYGNELWFHQYPDPPDGDFNDDGLYTSSDLDALIGEIAASHFDAAFDLNVDHSVDLLDRDRWLARAGLINLRPPRSYSLGDITLDGEVDGTDFSAWNTHQFRTDARWSSGDLNGDGGIDGSDFSIWNAHKFMPSAARSASVNRRAVPRAPLENRPAESRTSIVAAPQVSRDSHRATRACSTRQASRSEDDSGFLRHSPEMRRTIIVGKRLRQVLTHGRRDHANNALDGTSTSHADEPLGKLAEICRGAAIGRIARPDLTRN